MVYFGKIQNGKIVPESELRLPEGARVRIEPITPSAPSSPGDPTDPVYRLGDDAVETGITDFASEHDHYIYGTPKRADRGDA
jgi:hypothetical protein